MKRVLPHLALLPLVCLACTATTSDTSPPGETSSELDTVFPGGIVGTPFTAAFAQNWDDLGATTDDTKCRGCGTTPDFDPASQATTTLASGTFAEYTGSITPWAPGAGGLKATYAAAAAAGDAIFAGGSSFNNVDAELNDVVTDLNRICDVLNVGCVIKKDDTETSRWARAFPKVQGRHLIAAYRTGTDGLDRLEAYRTPRAFGELRSRAAKTYCAMRQAASAQQSYTDDAYTLEDGSYKDFAFWTLGKTGASVKIMPPQKFTSDRESEAFVMPITLAGWPNPISGFAMPNFDQLSHRMAWVSGDREILSAEDPGIVHDRVCVSSPFGEFCRPISYRTNRKAYRNLEHVDVFSGEKVAGHVSVDKIPVFMVPPYFNLTMGGDIYVNGGQVDDGSPAAAGRVRVPGYDGLAPRGTTFDEIGTPSLAADGPLALNGPFVVIGGRSLINTAATGFAPLTRWKQDDDRSVTIYDQVQEDLHLDATLGIKFGPVAVGLNAHSKLNVTQTQNVTLREQLSLVDGNNTKPVASGAFIPQTNLVVVPQSNFHATWEPIKLVLSMTLDFDLDLLLGTIHIHLGWDVPIYTSPDVTLGDNTILATDEVKRLRVGEYTDVGETAFDGAHAGPSVYSHVPNHTNVFASFPPPGSPLAGDTVSSCLADPKGPSDPPTPPPHTPPPGPGVGALCAVGPALAGPNATSPVPATLCTSSADLEAYAQTIADSWFANSSDPARLATQKDLEKQCLRKVAAYLCSGTSKLVSGPAISHVMSTTPDASRWGDLQEQCIKAFSMGTTEAAAPSVTDLVSRTLMPITLCKPDGTPY